MKQAVTQEKYSIAWFKLAEFVTRGEKERALALYKLLAHSLKDEAFASQLEGDLRLSFSDEDAFGKYGESVRLYGKQLRMIEATAVYEHMVTLEPEQEKELLLLIDLYEVLAYDARVFGLLQRLMRLLIERKQFASVSLMLKKLDERGQSKLSVPMHQELVQAWLRAENPPTDPVMDHVKCIIDYYFTDRQQKSLQSFLMSLRMLHERLYEKACTYLENNQGALLRQG